MESEEVSVWGGAVVWGEQRGTSGHTQVYAYTGVCIYCSRYWMTYFPRDSGV